MNGEFAAALCRVVNDWLLEYCSADPQRLRAVGLIPCQAAELAVKELDISCQGRRHLRHVADQRLWLEPGGSDVHADL